MTQKSRYGIYLSRTAHKDYLLIYDKKLLRRINAILDEGLRDNPFLGKPLHGEFKGLWSIKTFSFRIIYEVDKTSHIITVLKIQHRRDSYR